MQINSALKNSACDVLRQEFYMEIVDITQSIAT